MKTLYLTRLAAIALLACTTLFLASCGEPQEEKDIGPNANLSNEELLKKAIANMKAMKSYHFDFKGGVPSEGIKMSPNMSISADMQFNGKGSRAKFSDPSPMVPGLNPDSVVLPAVNEEMLMVEGHRPYLSDDGGKTWVTYGVDTPEDYLMAMFGAFWIPHDYDNGQTYGEQMLQNLTLKDGSPRLERIDGVLTRHITAEMAGHEQQQDLAGFAMQGAKTASLWVSTDITPTIRQMRIEGSNVVRKNEVATANDVAFSPDGKTLAVAHADGMIRLWDLTQHQNAPRKLRGNGGSPVSVAFSPDGKTLAVGLHSGGPPSEVLLWGMSNLKDAPVILATNSAVSSVAFRPDGKMLGAGVGDGVYLWEPPYKGAKATVIPYPEHNVVNSVAFSPNNRTLAAGNLNADVRLHDARNPQAEPTILPHKWVEKVAFSPDGSLLASVGGFTSDEGKGVKIWDLQHLEATPKTLSGTTTLAFSPDGEMLATFGATGIELRNISNLNATPALFPISDTDPGPKSLAFSPDSLWLAVGFSSGSGVNGEVRLYDLAQPQANPVVYKEDEQPTDTPYTLTWKWSRFNEDFGEVKPPAAETIRNP